VETLSAAAPDWLAQVVDVPGWSRRYGRRIDSWKMPASKTKQDTLAIDYARDGFSAVAFSLLRLEAGGTDMHSTAPAPVTSPASSSPLPHNHMGNRVGQGRLRGWTGRRHGRPVPRLVLARARTPRH
jgi:hypothetical protein